MPTLKRLGVLLGIVLLLLSFSLGWLGRGVTPTYAGSRTTPIDVSDDILEEAILIGEEISQPLITADPLITPTLDIEIYLPLVAKNFPHLCPTTSGEEYSLILLPDDKSGIDHPDRLHGDLNLALRGYQLLAGPTLGLLSISSPPSLQHTDPISAPRLPFLFANKRVPIVTAAYQINDWLWD